MNKLFPYITNYHMQYHLKQKHINRCLRPSANAGLQTNLRKTLDTTHMAVDIQGKGCCVMSQVALDGLDIVPSLQESHCVAVAQVMKPCVRHTDIIGDALEVVVRGAGRQVSTHSVAKHIEMVCQRMGERF